MSGKKSARSRSRSAASNSESELTLGNTTIVSSKTDSVSEHNIVSPKPSRYQAAHSLSQSFAEKCAIGDGAYWSEKEDAAAGCQDFPTSQTEDVMAEGASAGGNGQQMVYTDPVYQKLSRLNGEINRMNKDQLRKKLAELHLHTGGVKEVLKKRLKNYYRRKKLTAANISRVGEDNCFDFLVVIDYEATCQENNDRFVHEIIEFPAVLVDIKQAKIVGMFREFCKPRLNPVLTEFCKKLTGVNQSEVDNASEFAVVLQHFEEWLDNYELGSKHTFCIVTDGPWDMQRFLSKQCEISEVPIPRWARRWINVRKAYCNFYDTRRLNLSNMLEHLGLEFEGRPHCGLDDSRNIARIVCYLLEDGCLLRPNEKLDGGPSFPRAGRRVDTRDGNPSGDFQPLGKQPLSKTQMSAPGHTTREPLAHSPTAKSEKGLSEQETEEDVEDLKLYYSLQTS